MKNSHCQASDEGRDKSGQKMTYSGQGGALGGGEVPCAVVVVNGGSESAE